MLFGPSFWSTLKASGLATAGFCLPRPLLDQLAEGGRLVIPVGDQQAQVLRRYRRLADGAGYSEEHFEHCRFVPLLGRFGHQEVL